MKKLLVSVLAVVIFVVVIRQVNLMLANFGPMIGLIGWFVVSIILLVRDKKGEGKFKTSHMISMILSTLILVGIVVFFGYLLFFMPMR